ncbi:MAG: hypothetical protein J2O44_01740 [Porphyrobacter sp.]|nr:hypothetical protein [Porphyrobacter sp.]
MRRYLVLSDESRHHPFLAALPPHVRRGERDAPPNRSRLLPSVGGEDVRQFLMAYCACLLAVTTYIF